MRDVMPYKNFAILAIVALSMPVLGYFLNRYEYISAFPYGAFYHSSISYGTYTSQFLLLVGSLGLLVGLVQPRLSLWFGDKNRKRVLLIYGFTLAVAFAVRYEAYQLSKIVFANEEAAMILVYEAMRTGTNVKEMEATIKAIDSNIRYVYRDTSPYLSVNGYPIGDKSKNAIEFAYPGFYPKFEVQSRVVVVMSADPRIPKATAERVFLLNQSSVRNSK